jgi:alkylation response protein AidB-like acyl-CoA dehydrogenase
VKFTKERKAFGKTVFEFQNTKFTLADLAAKLQVGWAHLDWAIAATSPASSPPPRPPPPSSGTPSCSGRCATPRSSSTAAPAT